jgi:ribonuclease HI
MRIPKGGSARTNAISEYQKTIDQVTNWFGRWKLPIAESKTKVKIFTRKNTTKPFPVFVGAHLHEPENNMSENVKYLGLLLDTGLKFNPHFNEMAKKVNLRLNVLKKIGGFSWGSDRNTLVKIYKAWIQPVILYGSNAMVSLNQAQRKRLARMQLACLRVASGCNTWVPTDLIEVELNVMPVELEMGKKLLKQAIVMERTENDDPLRIKWNRTKSIIKKHVPLPCEPNQPNNKTITQPNTTLGQSMRCYCCTSYQANDKNTQKLSKKPDPTAPRESEGNFPWPPLGAAGQRSNEQRIIAEKYGNETARKWATIVESRNGTIYYTDGSAERPVHNPNATLSWGGVSAGYFKLDYEHKTQEKESKSVGCIGDNVLGEMAAIDMALANGIENQKSNPRPSPLIVILSDCQEAIKITKDKYRKTIFKHCQRNINSKIDEMEKMGIELFVDWVPGHSNTKGNDIADEIAKDCLRQARQKDIKNMYEVPKEATKGSVNATMNTVWQMWWNRWEDTRSYTVMKEVGKKSPIRHAGELSRRDETVLTRLRVGNATHNGKLFITKRVASPKCQCGKLDSAEHRIFECDQYDIEREILDETLRKHKIEHDIYKMMSLEGKTGDEAKEILTALLEFLRETGLTSLFLWDPKDEEHGVEGLVLMKPVDTQWAKPLDETK